MSATATPAKVSREMLADRYDGLMEAGLDPSELQAEFDKVVWAIVDGVTRGSYHERDNQDADGLIDEAQQLVREHIIRRVDELGLAR